MSVVIAVNLFDLAANEDYRKYLKRVMPIVEKHGGRVLQIGALSKVARSEGGRPRQVFVSVEWPSAKAFEHFKADDAAGDVHPLRETGTRDYLWWVYERLDDFSTIVRPTD